MVMPCYLFDNSRDFLWQRDDRSRDLFGKKTRRGQPISSDNMASDRAIKGFNFKDERIVNGRWVNERHPDIIQLFFRVLAICHTAIPNVHEETGEISYEIESPDEASFVIAAWELGFEFFRRTQASISLHEVDHDTGHKVDRFCNLSLLRA